MKKLVVLVLLVPFLLSGCGESKETKRLREQNDSLMKVAGNRDEQINEFIQSFNEIEENLAEIKERENIIQLEASDGEINETAKERINNDIMAIYDLMLKNKNKLEQLERKYRNSNLKINEFKKMMERLNQQIEAKDNQIANLKHRLAALNINIDSLNVEIGKLSSNVEDLTAENQQKEEIIEEQKTKLNTAFYAIGTTKELKENNVITKEGGFIGIGRTEKLTEDFNKDYFEEINIKEFSHLTINRRKAEVITTHPADSYKLYEGDRKVDSLVITNPQKFWSVSKYLVVVVN